jgi:3'-5' exoribonuclease
MKKTFIDMLKAGQRVDDVFVGQDKQLAHKKNGEPYLTFSMADCSGTIRAVVWDNVDAMSDAFVSGDFIHVTGNVSQYREQLQVVVRRLEPADPMTVDSSDFLPTSGKNVGKMLDQLREITKSVKNQYLSKLLDAFFQDEAFLERFTTAPAAKKMHHAYLGGLLEHTLSICRIIQLLSNHYKGVDYELLLTGGILHDIGKVHEFTYERHIDYSDSGRLLNHIVLGVEMLDKKILAIDGFPEDLGVLLKHMIVSHHGNREFGSPEPPKTLEAIILNHLDDLDAKVTGVRTFMEREGSEDIWTSYHPVMDRFFYKGMAKKEAVED